MIKFIKNHKLQIGFFAYLIFALIILSLIDIPYDFNIYNDGRTKPLTERNCEELTNWLNNGYMSRSIGDWHSESTVIEIMKNKGCL